MACSNSITIFLITEVTLHGGSGPHEGNVFVKGRPVCHDSWDDVDAGVVCRSFSELIALRLNINLISASMPKSKKIREILPKLKKL